MLILSHELSYEDTTTFYRNYFEYQINMAAIARQRYICENKINIYTIPKIFKIISEVIYHSFVFRTASSTTRWLNISNLYA